MFKLMPLSALQKIIAGSSADNYGSERYVLVWIDAEWTVRAKKRVENLLARLGAYADSVCMLSERWQISINFANSASDLTCGAVHLLRELAIAVIVREIEVCPLNLNQDNLHSRHAREDSEVDEAISQWEFRECNVVLARARIQLTEYREIPL